MLTMHEGVCAGFVGGYTQHPAGMICKLFTAAFCSISCFLLYLARFALLDFRGCRLKCSSAQ
jgi:hypothetical protein